jgi:hypothetical protein
MCVSRRRTIGGQLHQARLLDFDRISRSIGNGPDDAWSTASDGLYELTPTYPARRTS